jgi:SpoVK/Ycf46/Vps4 family AAA+-type ATPase
MGVVETTATNLRLTKTPTGIADLFRGMTSYEIDQAIRASVVATKKDEAGGGKRIDPKIIRDFRQAQIAKTDLVSNVDVSAFSFDQVGGAGRFKAWVKETQATWSDAGAKFGLTPPKGVLCVGVWGCGKSLSVKAMGSAWGLPVVQLEMGRLRSSGVGESEAAVYRAIRVIEAIAPCIVWMDEAEKSLSGNASSGQSDAGTTSRMIGILSTWLQETQAKVCLAMTANSLKGLPVEFVNRMDERFFFDIPSESDRVDILKIHLAKRRQKVATFNLAELSSKGRGLVGREIEQAIRDAMVKSFVEKKDGLDEDILGAALASKPRLLKTMADEIKEIVDWVGYDPEAGDGIRARFASDPDREGALQVHGGGNG